MFCVFIMFFFLMILYCVCSLATLATKLLQLSARMSLSVSREPLPLPTTAAQWLKRPSPALLKSASPCANKCGEFFFLFFFTPQLNPNQLFPFFLTAGRHQHASSSQHFGDGAAGGHPRRHGVFGTSGVGIDSAPFSNKHLVFFFFFCIVARFLARACDAS